jgi:thioredoxin 1
MTKFFLLALLSVSLMGCKAEGPYDERADATKMISTAVAQAKLENLPVVIIFGANWCPDCRGLSEAIDHGDYATQIAKEFKIVKVNVGNFDANLEVAKAYGNPISGGIPGAAILSSNGKLIYVTKPGELASARNQSNAGIYNLFKTATQVN